MAVDSILQSSPSQRRDRIHEGQNLSYKADYLAVAREARVAFLVELKTDSSSRREAQDSYLRSAQQAGLSTLLSAFREVYRKTKEKKKYRHLLVELQGMGLIMLNRDSSFEIAGVCQNFGLSTSSLTAEMRRVPSYRLTKLPPSLSALTTR